MSSLEFIGYPGDYVKLRGVLSPARTGISPLEVPRSGTGFYSGTLHRCNIPSMLYTLAVPPPNQPDEPAGGQAQVLTDAQDATGYPVRWASP
jgi:hypothetical protein